MPRKFFRKYLPSHAAILEHRYLSKFGRFLQQPNLWHLNRRSVAGGVAVGLFAGMIPGPIQMLSAGLLAIPLRVNLPVAMATTWYTNPLTIGPLYVAAYEIGKLLVGGNARLSQAPPFDITDLWDWSREFLVWLVGLGKPLGVGLVVLAFGLAVTGWLAVWYGWRWQVAIAWQRRCKLRRERAAR
jgi:uncharacterized protein (DUF2062 family)